jgi:hypothetical protein
MLPSLILGKEIHEFQARARLSHHGSDRISPDSIMSGFFVALCGVFVSVDFDQNEPVRIIQSLNDIKTRDAGFSNARLSILDGGFTERLDKLGFHVDVNMND